MITVTISRRALVRAEACKEGLALFDSIAALQSTDDPKRLARVRVRWTPLAEVWLAAAAPGFAGWLRQRNFIPRIDLCGANLRGANLSSADLRAADFRGANLVGVYRSKSDATIAGWVVRDGWLVRGESS